MKLQQYTEWSSSLIEYVQVTTFPCPSYEFGTRMNQRLVEIFSFVISSASGRYGFSASVENQLRPALLRLVNAVGGSTGRHGSYYTDLTPTAPRYPASLLSSGWGWITQILACLLFLTLEARAAIGERLAWLRRPTPDEAGARPPLESTDFAASSDE